MAKIVRAEYEFCANLGGYQNEKIRLVAELGEEDCWEEVLENLKKNVHQETCSEKEYFLMQEEKKKLQASLSAFKTAFEEGLKAYEEMQRFTHFVGINKEFPPFPSLPEIVTKALNSSSGEVEFIQGES